MFLKFTLKRKLRLGVKPSSGASQSMRRSPWQPWEYVELQYILRKLGRDLFMGSLGMRGHGDMSRLETFETVEYISSVGIKLQV
ncbi:hypothetical protein Tco_0868702 [Tanacetum coccineum]